MPSIESEPKTTKPPCKKSFANTVSFLQDASVVPIDWKMQFSEKSKSQSQENWERMWEVVGLYAGTDDTLEDIAKKYDLTRERISQIFEDGVTKLHDQSSWQIANQHPKVSLDLAKPRTVKFRIKNSAARNGPSSKIAEELKKGASLEEIKSKLNITNISTYRPILLGWGIKIPYVLEAASPEYKLELEKLRSPNTPNDELHKIMVTIHHGRYEMYSKTDNPYIISITKAARRAGLYPHCSIAKISRLLLELGIPVVRAKYKFKDGKEGFTYFLASGKLKHAQLTFAQKPFDQYRKNPVTAIGFNNGEIPTTTQIQNSPEFKSLSQLTKEIGLKQHQDNKGRPRLTNLIKSDCPVPVFCYLTHYTYRESDQEVLKNYLLRSVAKPL